MNKKLNYQKIYSILPSAKIYSTKRAKIMHFFILYRKMSDKC